MTRLTKKHDEFCPRKEECGSCGWSQIAYEDQLSEKLHAINNALAEGGIDFEVKKIIPSPKTSHYRNKMDFVINYQGLFGLREKGKWWKVLDNHTCFISDEKIEKLFSESYDWVKDCGLSNFDRKSYNGFLRYIVVRTTSTGESMLNVVTSAPQMFNNSQKTVENQDFKTSHEYLKIRELADRVLADTVVWSVNETTTDVSFGEKITVVLGAGFITEKVGDFFYKISPNSFFQTNSLGAKELQSVVLEFAKKQSYKKTLDLYCGGGFFTIPLGTIGNVVGLDISKDNISDADENLKINKSILPADTSVSFICSKAEQIGEFEINPDLIVLDPPRSGLQKTTVSQILNYAPEGIIYVSCNFNSFARDMVTLGQFYSVEDAVAVDMFPHTPHVESVFSLRKHEQVRS